MQLDWPDIIRSIFSEETAFTVSVAILIVGLVVGYVVWRSTRRYLKAAGIPEAVEGTPFERTAQGLGTSTVGLVSNLAAVFVYVAAVILALNVSQLFNADVFWTRLTAFLPDLFVAIFALIIGLIAGDKAKLVVSERLRSVKLPEAGLLPELVKYSIFYLAALVALGQLGISTVALVVLLAAYAFGLVFISGLAFRDLLAAGTAGLYLLLTEPYSIGDEIAVDDRQGIVQEVDIFVTRIESEEREYIVPNQLVMRNGVVRIRE
ncbi:MAG: mechanosensitive ion channel domain-containing protein [Haloarculaceae archaeon]